MDPESYAALTVQSPRTDAETAAMENVPYHRLIGMLLCLSMHTRPDIAFATAILAWHMSAPRPVYWHVGKRFLRYPCGTKHFAQFASFILVNIWKVI